MLFSGRILNKAILSKHKKEPRKYCFKDTLQLSRRCIDTNYAQPFIEAVTIVFIK